MDKLKQYLKERENVDLIEEEHGFASYIINGEEIYIKDIFIFNDYRNQNKASDLADKIASIGKENGCKFMTGTVSPKANNSTTSLKVLLGYGFNLYSSHENLIVFKKDI